MSVHDTFESIISAAPESTPGTLTADIANPGNCAITAYDIGYSPDFSFTDRPAMRAGQSSLRSILGRRVGTMPFRFEAKGTNKADLTVTGAANSGGEIEITTSAAHGLQTGSIVAIHGIVGTVEANNAGGAVGDAPRFWVITRTAATTFTLDGSTFSVAYVSGGTVVVAPAYAQAMRSAGRELHTTWTSTITANTGTAVAGETLTHAGTGTAKFAKLVSGTELTVYDYDLGTAGAGLWTGATSGATFTQTTLAFKGWLFKLNTLAPACSFGIYMPYDETDSTRIAMVGCYSQLSFGWASDEEQAFLSLEPFGVLAGYGTFATPVDIPYETSKPKTARDVNLEFPGISNATVANLCTSSLNINQGSQITPRPCNNSPTGVRAYRISGKRTIGWDTDPEVHEDIDWHSAIVNETETAILKKIVGPGVNNTFESYLTAAQVQSNALGDRENTRIWELSGVGYAQEPLADNEWMIEVY